jgi:molybdopterin-guanine dinucleotide biosynthesis protein A
VHVVEALREAVDEVVAVSSAELELPALRARVVCDSLPGLGPLAGIREGLAHIEAELAYVTGTDAPFLTPEFVKTLLAFGCPAAPEADGHVQTLAAVYPRSALPRADALLAAGRLRPLFLLEAVDYRKVLPHELPDLEALRGFNTPQEYLKAVRDAFGNATATVELLGRAGARARRAALDVPVGTLTEVLAQAGPDLDLCCGDRVSAPFRVTVGGREVVSDARAPVGPGEQVVVMDADAEG